MTKRQAAKRLALTRQWQSERKQAQAIAHTSDCKRAMLSLPDSKHVVKGHKAENKASRQEKFSRHLWEGVALPSMRYPKAPTYVKQGIRTWHKTRAPIFMPLSIASKRNMGGGFGYVGKAKLVYRSKAFTIWS